MSVILRGHLILREHVDAKVHVSKERQSLQEAASRFDSQTVRDTPFSTPCSRLGMACSLSIAKNYAKATAMEMAEEREARPLQLL